MFRTQKEKPAPPLQLPPIPLLKTLEDTQYNRIIQMKQEMHKTQNRADTRERERNQWQRLKRCNWYYYRVLVLEDSVGAILLLMFSNNINKVIKSKNKE